MRHLVLLGAAVLLPALPTGAGSARAGDFAVVEAPAPPPLPRTPPVLYVGPPILQVPVPTYADPRTERCLPGFVLDRLIPVCVRHDEPRIVCDGPARDPACGVAAPNPYPYGLGAGLRRNY